MKQRMLFILSQGLIGGGIAGLSTGIIRFISAPSQMALNLMAIFTAIGAILLIVGCIIWKTGLKMISDDDDVVAYFSDINQPESVVPLNSRANFCTTCGTPITPDAAVCSKCGKQI